MSKNKLEKLRTEINSLDKELVSVLAKRFAVTEKVGKYKAKNNLPAKDPKREKELYASRPGGAAGGGSGFGGGGFSGGGFGGGGGGSW
jgi:chorismate mutase